MRGRIPEIEPQFAVYSAKSNSMLLSLLKHDAIGLIGDDKIHICGDSDEEKALPHLCMVHN